MLDKLNDIEIVRIIQKVLLVDEEAGKWIAEWRAGGMGNVKQITIEQMLIDSKVPRACLGNLFRWADTPQGFEYWRSLQERIWGEFPSI